MRHRSKLVYGGRGRPSRQSFTTSLILYEKLKRVFMEVKSVESLIQEAWDRGDPPPLEYFVQRLCKSKRKRQRKKWAGQRFVRVLGQFS
jgi:hypothetical protein